MNSDIHYKQALVCNISNIINEIAHNIGKDKIPYIFDLILLGESDLLELIKFLKDVKKSAVFEEDCDDRDKYYDYRYNDGYYAGQMIACDEAYTRGKKDGYWDGYNTGLLHGHREAEGWDYIPGNINIIADIKGEEHDE